MTEVEAGTKSLDCPVLWVRLWKRKEDSLSHIGLKTGGEQLWVV